MQIYAYEHTHIIHSYILYTGVNYVPAQNPNRVEKLPDGRLLVYTESGQQFGPYDQVIILLLMVFVSFIMNAGVVGIMLTIITIMYDVFMILTYSHVIY